MRLGKKHLMIKMIKHIFCDLDGTLYHNGISKEDVDAIKKIEN